MKVSYALLVRSCAATGTRSPIVTVTIAVACIVTTIIHVPVVVNIDARPAIVMAVVATTVVGMSPVARVMNVQVVAVPPNREGGGDAPEIPGRESVAGRVRVVINRVGARVIVVGRTTLIDDDLSRLIVGNVDNFFVDRLNLDCAVFHADCLVVVSLQIPGSISAISELFDSGDKLVLLCDNSLTEAPGPVYFLIHHLDDLGVVQQGGDRLVPGVIRLQRGIGLEFLQKPGCLDNFQRIGGGGQDNCEQVVWIQCDRANKIL